MRSSCGKDGASRMPRNVCDVPALCHAAVHSYNASCGCEDAVAIARLLTARNLVESTPPPPLLHGQLFVA